MRVVADVPLRCMPATRIAAFFPFLASDRPERLSSATVRSLSPSPLVTVTDGITHCAP